MSDLGDPPDATSLGRFPARTLRPGSLIYRVHHHELGPFWFGSAPADGGGNRFDLKRPSGSSYWALDPVAAALETLARRPVRMVPAEVLAQFSLTTAEVPRPLGRIANLAVKAARGFGLTAEIHTTTNRSRTQRWAAALHEAGFTSLIAMPRHDPSGTTRTLTLFGRAGEHRPFGWRWSFHSAPASQIVDRLGEWGIQVVPIPFEVATLPASK